MATEAVKDWKELKGINPDEFNKRFEMGEFDKFMSDKEFVNAHTSKALFEKPQGDPSVKPEPEPPKPSDQDEPWYRKEGYESEEEYREAVVKLRELAEKKQSQIDQFNAERGKAGEKNKEQIAQLEKARDEYKRKAEEAAKNSSKGTVDVPEEPIPPVPEDGDYGSAEFLQRYKSYQQDLKAYNTKRREYDSKVYTKLSETEKTLADLKGKTSLIESDHKTEKEKNAQEVIKKSWGNTMSEVAKLQEFDPALKMSKSFEEVNRVIQNRGYEEAAKLYPKKDIENFDRICDIVKEYHHVQEGKIDYSRPARHRSIKAAYYNLLDGEGKLDEYLHSVKSDGARQGREQVIEAINKRGDAAKPLPPGGAEKPLLEEMTETDLDKKLSEFSKPEYDAKLNADPAFRKEVFELMTQKAQRSPEWDRMIPPKWKEEFTPKK
jgi:hypothetical protein